MRKSNWVLAALLAGAAPAALMAQTTPAPAKPSKAAARAAEMQAEENEVVVTGQRQPGAVVGDIPPEVQLGAAEIRSYGVSTITELLDELSPQTESGRGRGGEMPVVLLDGQRISSFAEIRDIPTEAILRVDILPEEVALKYGYSANQKVVNFVLRRRFHATTGELTGSTSTEGGGESGKAEADLLHIRNGRRVNVAVSYQNSAGLKESQRDVVSSAQGLPYDLTGNIAGATTGAEIDPALSALAGMPVTSAAVPGSAASGRPSLASFVPGANTNNTTDVSHYRSLKPDSDALSVNAVLAGKIFGIGASLNASFGATGSDSMRGLPGATLLVPAGDPFSPFSRDVTLYRYLPGYSPLTQTTAGETAHLGSTFNGSVHGIAWTLTGVYDHSDSRTHSQTGIDVSGLQAALTADSATVNPFGMLPANLIGARAVDQARAIGNSGKLDLSLRGVLVHLPAGDVNSTLRLTGAFNDIESTSTRAAVFRDVSLSRGDGGGQLNLDVPITSVKNDFLRAVGDLSVNGNISADDYSDFGTLTTYGGGVTWKPIPRLTLIYSFTHEEGAPTIQQLGNPQVITPQVRVYDYVRGVSVDISQLDGGNAGLKYDTRHVQKIGATWKPLADTDLTLIANYVTSRTDNAIATLPAPTAAIEAAFPDRFVRDADGDLIRIDNRPVNFASETRHQLRWGFNFSKPLEQTNAKAMFEQIRKLREEGKGADIARMFDRTPGERRGPDGGNRQGQQRTDGNGDTPPPPPPGDGGPPPGDGGPPPGGGFGVDRGGGERGGGPGGPGGGGGFRGGGFGGRGAPNTGRLQFAVYHTWLFRDDILIAPGVPVLDLLHGAAAGSTGGQPQHQVEVQTGYSNNGIGARLSGKWQSATTVEGGTTAGASDLHFSDLTTLNFRLFATLGQIPNFVKYGWARGARVSLSVNNILDQRIKVRDQNGATPVSYQGAYLDPMGRSVSISFRKLFF